MKIIEVTGQLREELGKKGSKQVRNEGRIPCVLYGGEEVIHFSTTLNEVKNLIYTPQFRLANINIDGTSYQCFVKDYQLHPVTDDLVHIDFLKLVEGRSIKVEVPITFKGSSPGVKLGGKLQQNLRRVKIKTTPEHLVDNLSLDVSKLELGQSIRVRDIVPNEGIEIMNAPGIPVATVEIPRALRSATAAKEKAGK